MSGDFTRISFDPHRSYSGVRKQQGRVSLDSDFNELEAILDRRGRAAAYDTFGPGVVPETTKHGFEIGVDPLGGLTIGIGRAYVHGIAAECFGDRRDPKTTVFDPVMNNLVGSGPLPFDLQPFHYPGTTPAFPALGAGYNLLYLDVWQREVTAWEDPGLIDPALGGPDTDTRVQTAWQVKAWPDATADACAKPPAAWVTATAASTARMTAAASPVAPAPGPCIIAPAGGYTGLENRLYRVEIYKAGTLSGAGAATFTWSRDNASLVASVLGIKKTGTTSVITVESTGRDSWMRFENDQALELLDDGVEFAMRESGRGGPMTTIKNVNHATGEIEVWDDLYWFILAADRHPRVRRWDTSAIAPVAVRPVANGSAFDLEEGIRVSWGDGTGAHAGDTFHAGDFWTFAARTADGSIQHVENEPPHGILHHFMPLAVVAAGAPPNVVDDCRVIWPPACTCDGGGCDCDACVTVASHTSGSLTVQAAVKQVIAGGGGTVCIGVGIFPLGDLRVELSDAISVEVRGKGIATILEFGGVGPAIRIDSAIDIRVHDLALLTERSGAAAQDAIEVSNAAEVVLERLTVVEDTIGVTELLDKGGTGRPMGGAVALAGFVLRSAVRDCVLAGGGGVVARSWTSGDAGDGLVAAELDLERDLVLAATVGIGLGSASLPGAVILADRTTIRACAVYGCEEAGIRVSGAVVAGHVQLEDNAVGVLGTGIEVAADRVTATGNLAWTWRRNGRGAGIAVIRGDGDEVAGVRVADNRAEGFGLAGILVDAFVTDLAIAGNTVADCAQGIVMSLGSRGRGVHVSGNTVNDIGSDQPTGDPVFGIALFATAEGSVTDNTVRRIAITDPKSPWRAGIQATSCPSVRIAGNTVADIGPREFGAISVGIASSVAFDRLDVLDNDVRPGAEQVYGRWYALLVGPMGPWGAGTSLGLAKFGIWLLGGGITGAVDRDRPGEALIRGNHLVASGRSSAVLVIAGECTFSDNQVRVLAPIKESAVVLGAEAARSVLVVGGNQVRQQTVPNSAAVEAWPVLVGVPGGVALTATGNVTDGEIRVNPGPLAPQWQPLNVRLS